MSETTKNRRPVHKIRQGSVIASIWADNSLSGYFYNTTFCKIYKNGNRWCDTFSYEDRDLSNLAKAATDAHAWIAERNANAITIRDGEKESKSTSDPEYQKRLPVVVSHTRQ